jgi:2,4-dienoyl-CoA reductase-like NADH-dependent reductase (Old Yellow Enzyme family)
MTLFDSYDLGGLMLPNRVVMAPMTRSRAPDTVPNGQMALYYEQRAGAGLIVTEGAQITPEGTGYLYTPGIYSRAQIAGWRQITQRVHDAGGRIFLQLWHTGRVSHRSLQIDCAAPVSSVVTIARTSVFAYDANGEAGPVPASEPRMLTTAEVWRVVEDFAQGAENALEAGFDGVEIHGANGYLVEQFTNGGLNRREDEFGGPIENRLRFVLETVSAVARRVGAHKVGLRLSPFGRLFDMPAFDDEAETWQALAIALSSAGLAYVHLSDQEKIGGKATPEDIREAFRGTYKGTLILAGGYNGDRARAALDAGLGDLIAFGRPYISNPDLVARLRNGWPLARFNAARFYGGGGDGYIDYPAYAA